MSLVFNSANQTKRALNPASFYCNKQEESSNDLRLHSRQAHTIAICKAICIDENQVDKRPDAEAATGEELKNTDDRMAGIKAMNAKVAKKHAEQCAGDPTLISPYPLWMIKWTARLVFEVAGHNHNDINKDPDTEASTSEELKHTADNMASIKAMDTQIA